MLNYEPNESKNSSHFFITTKADSKHLLSFQKLEEETIFFNSEFLQDNVFEMTVVRYSEVREVYCKDLAITIKTIFDNMLFKHDNLIVYLSVPNNSWKYKLIRRNIIEDTNDEFHAFTIAVDDTTFFFFYNSLKTDGHNCLNEVAHYFKSEYEIDLKLLIQNYKEEELLKIKDALDDVLKVSIPTKKEKSE